MSNNRKLVLYIATSLDGYIATEDDSLEWLFKTEGEGDNGYSEFYNTVDTILIGRRTYDWIIEKKVNFLIRIKSVMYFLNQKKVRMKM
jgi:dihydrofolate reductase